MMDVSILQHSRDSCPQQVAVAEVVELIQGSQWPPGYQPLLIAASVVQGGRQRKHIRWLTGGQADRTLVGPTRAVPLCHDMDVWYRDPPEAMPFLSTDIGGKQPDKTKDDNSKVKATNKDIKEFLANHIHLRRNMVTSRVEYRAMDRIINSQYAAAYYPFHRYLESLPKWNGQDDAIRVLSLTVTVKGGEEKQELFYQYLKKWLVGMVAALELSAFSLAAGATHG